MLGVLFTPDLALEKQVTSVSDKCFFQLRQLRRVRRSLDRDSAATLVHAFVTSRIHCESKKQDTIVLSVTLPNVYRFSTFFHC